MSVSPGSFSVHGRAAYYRSEAMRIEALAAASGEDDGRECFARVAQEYRGLAERLETPVAEDDEEDAMLDAGQSSATGISSAASATAR